MHGKGVFTSKKGVESKGEWDNGKKKVEPKPDTKKKPVTTKKSAFDTTTIKK